MHRKTVYGWLTKYRSPTDYLLEADHFLGPGDVAR
jgi:hypothetical protein